MMFVKIEGKHVYVRNRLYGVIPPRQETFDYIINLLYSQYMRKMPEDWHPIIIIDGKDSTAYIQGLAKLYSCRLPEESRREYREMLYPALGISLTPRMLAKQE